MGAVLRKVSFEIGWNSANPKGIQEFLQHFRRAWKAFVTIGITLAFLCHTFSRSFTGFILGDFPPSSVSYILLSQWIATSIIMRFLHKVEVIDFYCFSRPLSPSQGPEIPGFILFWYKYQNYHYKAPRIITQYHAFLQQSVNFYFQVLISPILYLLFYCHKVLQSLLSRHFAYKHTYYYYIIPCATTMLLHNVSCWEQTGNLGYILLGSVSLEGPL